MSWRDLWGLLLDVETTLPEKFTARQLLDALQTHVTAKMQEEYSK